MPQVIINLLTSTRVLMLIATVLLAWAKQHYPDLNISEKDMADILHVVIAVIIGDTIRPVNPEKQPLIGAKPQ